MEPIIAKEAETEKSEASEVSCFMYQGLTDISEKS